MRIAGGTKRLEDRGKRNTLLLVSMEFSAFGGNIEGDDAEVSRGHNSSWRVKARTQENALSHMLCTLMKPTGGDD